MTIIDALVDILGEFPDEYVWLLYAAAILVFVLFMYWLFGLMSQIIVDVILTRKK